MNHKLPELPFSPEALEPYISKETLSFHHGKHHQAYVNKLNELIQGTQIENKSLEEIIKTATPGPIFNNAAQIWNHTFYWHCLAAKQGGNPKGAIADGIHEAWGDFEKFKTEFTNNAIANFGSGWTWLVKTPDNKLKIVNTSNAGTPITTQDKPILTIDIWEHAYYIDYKNARPKYVDAFWNLVNWDFANKNI